VNSGQIAIAIYRRRPQIALMQIFRTTATATLARWAEPLVLLAALGFSLRLVWLGWQRNAWILLVIGAVLATALASLVYLAILRVRLARAIESAGLVEVDERQITYLAPRLGGRMDLDDIDRIALSGGHTGGQSWILYQSQAAPLIIPLGAQGADTLPDAFAALPGLGLPALHRAVLARRPGLTTIWEKHC
jgi:hypothetical protein